jgi:peptide/nickel transport system permease protein
MAMRDYLIKRGASALVTLALAIVLNFFLFRIMPGDPTRTVVGDTRVTPEVRKLLIHQFGLDQPLWIQFVLYLRNLLVGNLGISFQYRGTAVANIIFGRRLFNTFILMGSSIGAALVIGIIVGTLAAWKRESKFDIFTVIFSLVTYSMPVFWLGMMIILVFGYYLNSIPIAGTMTVGLTYSNVFEYAADYLHHMTGPFVTLTLSFIGYYFLIMRDSILDVFTEDYMLTAKAKGLSDRKILFRHAMRNATLPMVSLIAVEVTYLFGGATMTETVFSWYGIGRLIYEAVVMADFPVLQGIFVVMSVLVITANFCADIAYALLDPRIRY